jgi:tripartite-type tricarboxylate transporter receptor subunit TctC
MPTRRKFIAGASALSLTAPALIRSASAQADYPNKPIRILVPYPAGGGQDTTARLLAEPLRQILGQTFVVENRAGAAGMLAADMVAKSAPDGYTLLLGGGGETAANGALFKGKITYDVVNDLTPIHVAVKAPIVLMVHAGTPYKTIQDLIAFAKANPDKLSYSSSGIGNLQHLSGELFNTMAGVKTVHVPYRGAAPAVTDIAGGQIPFGYNSLPAALPLIQDGKIRPIGVTSKERMPQLPDVPAIHEVLNGYELVNYFGVFGPGKMPAAVVEKLNSAIEAAMKEPTLRSRFEGMGLLPQSQTPAQAKAFVAGEAAKFEKIITDAKVSVDG